MADKINYTCIIEKGKPENILSQSDGIDSGARLYNSKSLSERKSDFMTTPISDWSLTELFEIDESLSPYFKKGDNLQAFAELSVKKGKTIDAKLLDSCRPIIDALPETYDSPFEWEGVWLGDDTGLNFEKLDEENEIVVFSFEQNGKEYILYAAVDDFWGKIRGCYENGDDCFEFEDGECLTIPQIISEELEIDVAEIKRDSYYIYLHFGDDYQYFVSNEDWEKIEQKYINKLTAIKDLIEKLIPSDKQWINEVIYLS